ncbi:MAG: SpoVR family protein [Acidobacteria bacterium]|nr:SpoVR family protein [Acidobacteriota bacterium]
MDREIKELEKALEQIWDIALKFGLDPFPVHFEIVPATVMYEIGSYALPGRYSHWTFGKAYHRMKMMYDLGLSRIYEVVINTNPSYGFLLETNSLTQNKLVIAHVLGHVDFFKNNAYFSRTNRRMVDEVGVHSSRINEYEFTYGRKTVEEFLDAVLSIEEHVDPDFLIKKARNQTPSERQKKGARQGKYDDMFTDQELDRKTEAPKIYVPGEPVLPEKDLVWFIAQYSPILEPWQRDIMSMVHEEMLYFVPQMQTKTLNEGWACCTGDSILLTENGFIRFDQLYEDGRKIQVASGRQTKLYPITDFHKEEQVPTIRIRTRRGLTIEGSHQHRVLLSDGSWGFLKDLQVGDQIPIECGANIWPTKPQAIPFQAGHPTPTLEEVAVLAGVSIWTVLRHLKGRRTQNASGIQLALQQAAYQPGRAGKVLPTRVALKTNQVLDDRLAWVLGYFIGDGNRTKSGICFTTGDEELAIRLEHTIPEVWGVTPLRHWDPTEVGGRWRVIVHSRELLTWLNSIGINLAEKAPQKRIPDLILRSPKNVISAFLRGYFDADAYAGKHGIILSSSSQNLIHLVQVILLNYGILSTQQPCQDSCTQLHIKGASAKRFLDEIGFSLSRKQQGLTEYVECRQWFRKEDFTDEIVSIEPGCADVYDITVATKHAYVANGMVHHNSFWHARIMRELGLEGDEYIEFAELHAGVVSPHKGQLNPYYLGYKILEDIERRWDNPTAEEREKYGRKGGEGRHKLFEVREMENDTSLLRNYLTEQLVEELDLYVYELVDDEEWTITEKRWERVRDQLVASRTNFGFPYIEVTDADYNRNRELYLTHRFEGTELDLKYGRKVLEYVQKLWGRTVHLETMVDNESLVLHYDGKEHDED